ncbi:MULTISPECIES: N-acetyltransferase [Paenibacillus]|uniref:GNAT family N-acetyltransferase n=1 Tax=Paenibacillus odorifer TaxID=189426 RepID=A0A1R0X677_9BACL|nr:MULTISPECIES: N-acetyltransferase [Paenibacillus]AIQ73858.1 GCN5 family acetyltransferase [Paenibacillus odorifer]ETT49265.1 N-acetyltransferase GCN5 [Paenibacillus sp. FSL H8-237]OMD13670.1 GNAT family N-acetyltransferase [Paenibacillus odorifer]OMD24709.1 GNAT family N-acetyltransferase [Paenibacillus odorifer]OMD30101.1 GNAT family N-acetyltransferase [Paenibacillus odorifer]
MRIRTETVADYNGVFQVNVKAFGDREDEARLVENIRNSQGFIPELSIVAEKDNEIVGHLLLSKAVVQDGEKLSDVIALAPLAVLPNVQKQGIGKALIQEGLERCRTLGYELVFLIGHPEYYPRFGFQPAGPHGLELKQFEVPERVFMVCELKEGVLQRIKGELKYPETFF